MTTTIKHENELTQAHYDLLAKAVCTGRDGDDESWEDEMFDEATSAIAATRDEMSDFDGAGWREAIEREDFEIDGVACRHWGLVQPHKGAERVQLTVIDLGDLRLVYTI